MIDIYVGGIRAKQEMFTKQASYVSQHPGIIHVRVDGSEAGHLELVESTLDQVDLFGSGTLISIDGIFNKKEERVDLATKMLSSSHDIILYQNELPKWFEQLLQSRDKKKVNVSTYPDRNTEYYDAGATFAIADAFIKGDKRLAWTEYVKSIRTGVAPEEIHGILFWALKSLWLSRILNDKDSIVVGVKANVRNKYLQYGKVWGNAAIIAVLDQLRSIYHDAHRGEGELEVHLEMLLLNLQTKA